MAWDKTKIAEGVLAPDLNDEIRENWSALEAALTKEMYFSTGGTASLQGILKQGSARAFFQDTAPATRKDGSAFTSTDLGLFWVDSNSSPDNQLNILTATTPTWTPVSTEIIAAMLAAARVFASTLGVTGDFAVNTNKFVVTAASGNTLVAGTLDVTGNIDPTTYETTNGGFLDEDDMASAATAADKVASQQSIKAFVDASVGDSYHLIDIDGTSAKVYTKYFTGTLDSDSATSVAHNVTSGLTKILSVSGACGTGSSMKVSSYGDTVAAQADIFNISYDGTNVRFGAVGSTYYGRAYRIKIDYIL